MECEAVHVGIDRARPDQGEELEVPLFDVVVEGSELIRSDLDADADIGQHRLDDLGLEKVGLVRRGLEGQFKAGLGPVAVGVRKSGRVE